MVAKRKPVERKPPAVPKQDVVIGEALLALSRQKRSTKPDVDPFAIPRPPEGVIPAGGMAMDEAFSSVASWAGTSGLAHEGLVFLGYPYLAELAQRPEYRRISEIFARHMTRRWIKIQARGEDDKTEKVARIEEAFRRLKVQEHFRRVAELDGFFGRAHLFMDLGSSAPNELDKPVGDGWDEASRAKVEKGGLKGLRVIEPVWTYPAGYNSADPLAPNWYRPTAWFVMGKKVDTSRLLTFVGREVPDLLKPAYSFGGLSRSQMLKPYVDDWLRNRESVSDIVDSFTVFNLATNLAAQLNAGNGEALFRRAEFFVNMRRNRGLLLTDKTGEEFNNVSAPLGTLDVLKAQSLENICSIAGIPIVEYTGDQPTGLNASSEGAIRSFYEGIHSEQESMFRPNLTRLLGFVQLSEFGEVDPDITFEFEPLWSLSEKEVAEVRNIEAQTDQIYDGMGAIRPEDVTRRLAADPDSPYAGLTFDEEALPPPDENDPDAPELERRQPELKAA